MMRKNIRGSFSIFLALLVLVSLAGCAKPPTHEISQAELAFQQATDADAQAYAADQYMSAEEALNEARQLMEQKKYKQAKEKALEATKMARDAHLAAVNSKNASNNEAKQMYDLALAAVNSANEAGAYNYAASRPQIEEAKRTLQEAGNAYQQENYKEAKQLAEAALTKARAAETAAKQAQGTEDVKVVKEALDQIQSPATPKPYPTEHVVIKGESLWWIAEYKQIYDDPFQWPLIYRANRSKIKDPDLIYPDQVFKIERPPELNDEMVKEAIKFAKNRGAWSLHDGK